MIIIVVTIIIIIQTCCEPSQQMSVHMHIASVLWQWDMQSYTVCANLIPTLAL